MFPELGVNNYRTTDIVFSKLDMMGFDINIEHHIKGAATVLNRSGKVNGLLLNASMISLFALIKTMWVRFFCGWHIFKHLQQTIF